MLVFFRLKNVSSFRDDCILDMRATQISGHPSHVVELAPYSLLKACAVYGANASGKSNLVAGMYHFRQFILGQLLRAPEGSGAQFVGELQRKGIEGFLLQEGHNGNSEMEIAFVRNGKLIEYGFVLGESEIVEEWLSIEDKPIYTRYAESIEMGRGYKSLLKKYDNFPKHRLFLSVLDFFLEGEEREKILSDLLQFLDKEFIVYSELLFESSVKGLGESSPVTSRLTEDASFRSKVEQYLRHVGVGIKGLEIRKERVFDEQSQQMLEKKQVYTLHSVFDDKGEEIATQAFYLQKESMGTLRFLGYIQYILECIEQGGVCIIDELSARLHPLLSRLIVQLFTTAQNKNAQLIFTTHDVSLLDANVLRKDAIALIDKDSYGVSRLYALSDFKSLDESMLSKAYLRGKYGAIPIFSTIVESEDA